jgi:membrane-associated phospholipid phosphatase
MSIKTKETNLETTTAINNIVIANYSKLKTTLLFLPLLLLISIFVYLYSQNAMSDAQYVECQKSLFLFFNALLSPFPNMLLNLTQIGDAFIFLSFLSIFIIYAPKMWESLLSGSIISGIFSPVLKNLFAIPRPAQALDHHTFTIVGRTMPGFSSLPSGHSITVFTVLTILLFALMPKKRSYKVIWILSILLIGAMLVLTRVGIGAHFPLDVLIGSIIGCISGLIGIFVTQKYKLWAWIGNKKYYPFFMLLFLAGTVVLINKIIEEYFIIYYFALTNLIFSLYKIIHVYFKK